MEEERPTPPQVGPPADPVTPPDGAPLNAALVRMVGELLDFEGATGVTIVVDCLEGPGTIIVRTKTGQLSESLHMSALLCQVQNEVISKMFNTLQAAKKAEIVSRFEALNDDGE